MADVDPRQRLAVRSVNTARQRFTKAGAPMEPDFIYFFVTFLVVLIVFAIGLRLLVPIILQHFKGSAAGWRRLSEIYATARQRPAQVYTRQSIVVGEVLYRNCMIVGFGDTGLYLEIGFPISLFGRRRLFIPWTAFKSIDEGRLFWRKAAVLSVGEPLVGTITVPMKLFDMIQPAIAKTATKPGGQDSVGQMDNAAAVGA